MSLQFAIVAGALTGNRGSEAMVTTCIEQIQARYPDATVHVLSYYPSVDCREKLPPNVLVHSSSPLRIVTNWLPVGVLTRALPSLRRELKKPLASIRELVTADAVMDVAGVAFIDGREKFLPFNVLTLLPFLINGVAVYKLSQAIGPIHSPLNRIAAKMILPYLRFIGARGPRTEQYLRDFGLRSDRVIPAPDVTFLLEPERHVPYAERPKRVAILPSAVLQGKSTAHSELLTTLADALADDGHEIVLIAHSYRSGSSKSFNNDLPIAHDMVRRARNGSKMRVLGEGLNARQIKTEIGQCRAAITSRFHGMIAALGTSTPVTVVGWSHKYKEVLASFDLEDACFDYRQANADVLIQRAKDVLAQGARISDQISAALPRVKAEAKAQFDRMFDEVK